MSINLYKDWDPSKGDYTDKHFEAEISKRRKDRRKARIQMIVYGAIFLVLLVVSIYYAYKLRR